MAKPLGILVILSVVFGYLSKDHFIGLGYLSKDHFIGLGFDFFWKYYIHLS